MSDLPPLPPPSGQRAAEASAEIVAVETAAKKTAESIETAFNRAGESIAKSLAKAATDGKVSFGELAAAVLNAVEAFGKAPGSGSVLGQAGTTLAGALGDIIGGVFKGARADGGPVAAGGAYLVGERGPEVFRPGVSGEVGSPGGGPMVVNVTVQGGGAAALLRSEAQIAAALARAVGLGARP